MEYRQTDKQGQTDGKEERKRTDENKQTKQNKQKKREGEKKRKRLREGKKTKERKRKNGGICQCSTFNEAWLKAVYLCTGTFSDLITHGLKNPRLTLFSQSHSPSPPPKKKKSHPSTHLDRILFLKTSRNFRYCPSPLPPVLLGCGGSGESG